MPHRCEGGVAHSDRPAALCRGFAAVLQVQGVPFSSSSGVLQHAVIPPWQATEWQAGREKAASASAGVRNGASNKQHSTHGTKVHSLMYGAGQSPFPSAGLG
jgi:hypothetical protein